MNTLGSASPSPCFPATVPGLAAVTSLIEKGDRSIMTYLPRRLSMPAPQLPPQMLVVVVLAAGVSPQRLTELVVAATTLMGAFAWQSRGRRA